MSMSYYGGGEGYGYEWQMRDDNGPLCVELSDPHRCFVSFQFRYVLRTRKFSAGLGVWYNHDEILDFCDETDEDGTPLLLGEHYLNRKSFEEYVARKLARRGLPFAARQKLYDDIARSALVMKDDPINKGRMDVYMVVDITVCTLCEEGEPIEAARSRAVFADTFSGGRVKRRDLPELYNIHDFGPLEKFRVRCDSLLRGRECSICLQEPCVGEDICMLPCSHAYHFACIDRWLQKSDRCPYCRASVPL